MKALKLTALLLGAALFTGIGATILSAEDMKCGAGKCGSSMKAPMKGTKCGDGKMAPKKPTGKCGVGKCG